MKLTLLNKKEVDEIQREIELDEWDKNHPKFRKLVENILNSKLYDRISDYYILPKEEKRERARWRKWDREWERLEKKGGYEETTWLVSINGVPNPFYLIHELLEKRKNKQWIKETGFKTIYNKNYRK